MTVSKSLFGTRAGEGLPPHLIVEDLAATWDRARSRAVADGARLADLGWEHTPDGVLLPEVLGPQDFAALRAVCGGMTFERSVEVLDSFVHGDGAQRTAARAGGDAWSHQRVAVGIVSRYVALLDATGFLVPSADAHAILASDPPDPELVDEVRLPFDSVLVLFTHPFHFDASHSFMSLRREAEIRDLDRVLMTQVGADPSEVDAQPYRAFAVDGGAVAGMVLLADHDTGGLSDWVGWVVAAQDPLGCLSPPVVEWGRRSLSSMGPVAGHVACLVSWAGWQPPPMNPFDMDPQSREFRRAVRTSKFRRAAASGALDGVWILDLGGAKAPPTQSDPDAEPTGRTVRAHLRRGHWRGVWVGAHDSPARHREPRWIAPTVVGGHPDEVEDLDRVYRLPEPPDDTD